MATAEPRDRQWSAAKCNIHQMAVSLIRGLALWPDELQLAQPRQADFGMRVAREICPSDRLAVWSIPPPHGARAPKFDAGPRRKEHFMLLNVPWPTLLGPEVDDPP